ncbi:hypothetical protein CBOM_04929 [Ceraceosorus bombacis]|uniref:Transmembrane protein n=1 Tax=Ceraceosorus bombacis TaxID=401625 RepID=A0A0P1BHZ2_9BASI|nr:hypothetical protein CBOM_04929 [Ceraceosorus bombacis]
MSSHLDSSEFSIRQSHPSSKQAGATCTIHQFMDEQCFRFMQRELSSASRRTSDSTLASGGASRRGSFETKARPCLTGTSDVVEASPSSPVLGTLFGLCESTVASNSRSSFREKADAPRRRQRRANRAPLRLSWMSLVIFTILLVLCALPHKAAAIRPHTRAYVVRRRSELPSPRTSSFPTDAHHESAQPRRTPPLIHTRFAASRQTQQTPVIALGRLTQISSSGHEGYPGPLFQSASMPSKASRFLSSLLVLARRFS